MRCCFFSVFAGVVLVALSGVAAVDFTGVCIERTPKCNRYRVQYDGVRPYLTPGTENDQRWPTNGQSVTYWGHIYNAGNSAATCTYRWKTNSTVVSSGSILIPAGGFVTNSMSIGWPVDGHLTNGAVTIELELNYDNSVTESSKTNNTLAITTRDLALTWFFAQEYFDALSKKTNAWGTANAVDWLRIQVEGLHDCFTNSVWPSTPDGVKERVRIDRLFIEPNASLYPENDPYLNSNDGHWQIWSNNRNDPYSTVTNHAAWYANTYGEGVDNGLVHELMHQLGLIDYYNYSFGACYNTVRADDGAPTLFRHFSTQLGLMHDLYRFYLSETHAAALNQQLGRRRGYYGDFQYAMPRTNVLRVLDAGSNAMAGVRVRCWRRQNDAYITNGVPMWEGVTDANGDFELPNSGATYATTNGYVLNETPFDFINVVGFNQLVVEFSVTNSSPYVPAASYYRIVEALDANLKYVQGSTNTAIYNSSTRLAPAQYPQVALRVAHSGVVSRVEMIPPPDAPALVSNAVLLAHDRPYDDPWVMYSQTESRTVSVSRTWFADNWRYMFGVAPYYSGGNVGAASRALLMPDLPKDNMFGVELLADGHRLICARSATHEQPLWQLPNGAFIESFGLEHNHMWPYDAAYDAVGERVLAIKANGTDFSVYVIDMNGKNVSGLPANPFGSYGAGNGQFDTPKGIAVDSESRIYVADTGNNRVQVFEADGSYLTQYTSLSGPSGVDVDSQGRVLVADTGNNRIVILTLSGTTLSLADTITGLSGPFHVVHGDNDEIFVTESTADRVSRYSAAGSFVESYTVPGGETGSLNNPTGIAFGEGGYLVVADSGNRRVVEIQVEAPDVTGIALNEGRGMASDTNISLQVQAVGHPLLMRIGNSPTEAQNDSWRPYTENRVPWSFDGGLSGVHTVCVKVISYAGETSAVEEAVIELGAFALAYVTNAPVTVEAPSYALQGTNNSYAVGTMSVSNSANGASSSWGPVGPGAWTAPALSLNVGSNPFVVSVSNSAGQVSSLTVTVTRTDNSIYVSKSGNDSNDGLTPQTAKATVAGAMAVAQYGQTIQVGTGTWSGASNYGLDWSGKSGVNLRGCGPTGTVFAATSAGSFITGLDAVTSEVRFAGFKVDASGVSLSGVQGVFYFGYSHNMNLACSNLWLVGSYDGDLVALPQVNGIDNLKNGTAIYLEQWGGGAYYNGEIQFDNCLFEGWGAVLRFNDYAGTAGACTTRFTRCTVVNCSDTQSGYVDGSVFWYRGTGTGRKAIFEKCVMSHSVRDTGTSSDTRFFSLGSSASAAAMIDNLIHTPSLTYSMANVYKESTTYFTGEENDINDVAPAYTNVEGFAYSLMVTNGGTARGWKTYSESGGTVETPGIAPDGGSFSGSIIVTVSCATAGAEIRYTSDLSDPSAASAPYTAPLTITNTTTLKARAFKAGMASSAVASATFELLSSGADTNGIWLEAENGIISNDWHIITGETDTSGGDYVSTTNNVGTNYTTAGDPDAGTCRLQFTSSNDTYAIWMRVITPTTSDDSFHVKIDGESYAMWDCNETTTWGWQKWTEKTLTEGAHTLTICQREDGAKMDKVLVSHNLSYTPTGQGGSEPEPGADTDSDGIADSWELAQFGNLTTADGNSDQDADGQLDLEEYIAGTQPTNALSVFEIDLVEDSSSAEGTMIRWIVYNTNAQYTVMWGTNLVDEMQVLSGPHYPAVETSMPLAVTDTVHSAIQKIYYRLKVEPAP